ncbi:hypothetical protein MMC25_002385 [Agyrium rufum]|nr:hypothetical protein [Agyrium rufum]
MVLRKDQLEASLHEENKLIETGRLKEDNPLDFSDSFQQLCEACRRGDLKVCQESIVQGANINARDQYDYTPLILASLCGHYDVVQLLLESGALCERDTFQGERCLYNALNDRIRNLLLAYDYSKSSDPLQPLASHVYSLLIKDEPKTSDIKVYSVDQSFNLHKFVLAARSPYFRKKLAAAPETLSWKLPSSIPPQAFDLTIRYIYFGEIPSDVGGGPGTGYTDEEILEGIDKLGNQFEIAIGSLWDLILNGTDKRIARQKRTEEIGNGRYQLEAWFQDHILRHKIVVDTSKANDVRWNRENGIFADVLLRADDQSEVEIAGDNSVTVPQSTANGESNGIPIDPLSQMSIAVSKSNPSHADEAPKSTIFPAHRAMLLRSEYFATMFSSAFLEAQPTTHLRIIPVSCTPDVLTLILTYLYTERSDIPLELAVDTLFAADELFIEKLKVKAAVAISTLGNGNMLENASQGQNRSSKDESACHPTAENESQDENASYEPIDPYDVLRAAWLTRVPRLEEFAARYFAFRLESFIDEPEFTEIIKESAARIQSRQETDSIELVDDIRYYLSERFRLRFEDAGIEEMIDAADNAQDTADPSRDVIARERIEKSTQGQGILQMKEELSARKPSQLGSLPGNVGDRATPADFSTDIQWAEEETGIATAGGVIRTLDGELAGDEFASDAINYQVLLGKIDTLLERLKLDA